MAILGLIEIVSHILSYTRLVGILLASVVLDRRGDRRRRASSPPSAFPVGLIAGIVIVVVIQLFNIILGVFEPGIQGARLIFVENFSKYFTGNGRAFRPFGSRRQHTLPHAGDAQVQLPRRPGPRSRRRAANGRARGAAVPRASGRPAGTRGSPERSRTASRRRSAGGPSARARRGAGR